MPEPIVTTDSINDDLLKLIEQLQSVDLSKCLIELTSICNSYHQIDIDAFQKARSTLVIQMNTVNNTRKLHSRLFDRYMLRKNRLALIKQTANSVALKDLGIINGSLEPNNELQFQLDLAACAISEITDLCDLNYEPDVVKRALAPYEPSAEIKQMDARIDEDEKKYTSRHTVQAESIEEDESEEQKEEDDDTPALPEGTLSANQ
jgi:hypothetical protein